MIPEPPRYQINKRTLQAILQCPVKRVDCKSVVKCLLFSMVLLLGWFSANAQSFEQNCFGKTREIVIELSGAKSGMQYPWPDVQTKTLFNRGGKGESGNREFGLIDSFGKPENYCIHGLAMAVVILVLLLIFGSIMYRSKTFKNAAKEKQTQLVHNEQRQQLESDLESRRREVMDMAALITYKNQFINRIAKIIDGMLEERHLDKLKSSLVELKFELSKHKKSTREQDLIFENIETLQRRFYEKITAINADVTKKELLIASLIKLNIDTREMARILGVTEKSVRTYKYRLKKKLGLGENMDLSNYIRNL